MCIQSAPVEIRLTLFGGSHSSLVYGLYFVFEFGQSATRWSRFVKKNKMNAKKKKRKKTLHLFAPHSSVQHAHNRFCYEFITAEKMKKSRSKKISITIDLFVILKKHFCLSFVRSLSLFFSLLSRCCIRMWALRERRGVCLCIPKDIHFFFYSHFTVHNSHTCES